jgi:hypothetical protein
MLLRYARAAADSATPRTRDNAHVRQPRYARHAQREPAKDAHAALYGNAMPLPPQVQRAQQ